MKNKYDVEYLGKMVLSKYNDNTNKWIDVYNKDGKFVIYIGYIRYCTVDDMIEVSEEIEDYECQYN